MVYERVDCGEWIVMNIFKRFKRVEDKIEFLCNKAYEEELEKLNSERDEKLRLNRREEDFIWSNYKDKIKYLKRRYGK